MSSRKLTQIKAAVYEMGQLFNQEPSSSKINAYANALMAYEPDQIVFAFNQVIQSGSDFFPSLAKLLSYLKPKELSAEDVGNMIANEVVEKALEFGVHRISEAFANLSGAAQDAIKTHRMLSEICNSAPDQLPTIRAQIRGMARASHERAKAGSFNLKLEQVTNSTAANQVGFRPLQLEGILDEQQRI